MKKLFFTCISLLLLTACAGSTETVEVTRVVEVPVTVESISEVEVTRIVEVPVTVESVSEVEVEVTRIVEVTPEPTEEPEPQAGEGVFALNYIGSQEVGGLTVEVARVLVGDKDAVEDLTGLDFSNDSSFDNADVVAEIIFVVTNNGEETLNVYPDQATIQINDELIDLFDYFLADIGDDVGGEIPPGVKLVGGQWFGVKRNAVEDINQMIVRFSSPTTLEYSSVGEDFEITVDTSNHIFEELPEELSG